MVPTMPPDAHKISLKIIEAIKQHPVLYISDVKGTAIKLQEFRQKVWKKISDELGLDPAWVRLRWKNLRDTYCRILKYKNRTDKGSRRKKWIFEDHLSFLKFPYEPDYQPQCVELSDDYIQEINASGMTSETLLEQLEDRNDEDYSEYLEVLEDTTADPVLQDDAQVVEILDCVDEEHLSNELIEKNDKPSESTIAYAREIENNYIKIRPKRMKLEPIQVNADSPNNSDDGFKVDNNINTIVISTDGLTSGTNNINTITQNNDDNGINLNHANTSKKEYFPEVLPKTSIELFFNSMAQTVRLLPSKAQAEIKMSVCKIVTQAEVKYSKNNNNSKNIQKFIAPPGMIPKLVLIPCSMIDNPSDNK